MRYNFDKIINRKNTNCSKWDNANKRLNAEIELPLWVADMDFAAPAEVVKTVSDFAATGIYGYTYIPEKYYDSIIGWFERNHNWRILRDWILFSPGVVISLKTMIQAFTEPGDKIIIQTPVYPPFYKCVTDNCRELLTNPLLINNNCYEMDFVDLERKLKDDKTKMLIICNPHNPVGRVWTESELTRVAELCLKHKVFVISDEMHCDLVHQCHKHTAFMKISDKILMNSATCIAPSKTFNLAGLQNSNIIIANPKLRDKLKLFLYKKNGLVEPSLFGIAATIAAYNHGDDWLKQVIEYIYGNYIYLTNYLKKRLPAVRIFPLEATYLVWLDFNGLNISADELKRIIFDCAGVGLNDGRTFGELEGRGFQRMNIACPRVILKKAIRRIVCAFKSNNII